MTFAELIIELIYELLFNGTEILTARESRLLKYSPKNYILMTVVAVYQISILEGLEKIIFTPKRDK